MDANLMCALFNRAAKVSIAYDFGVECKVKDTCAIARVYFAQKLLDLGTDCDGVVTLQNHVDCSSFPEVLPPSPSTQSCPITISELGVVACKDINITVVQ